MLSTVTNVVLADMHMLFLVSRTSTYVPPQGGMEGRRKWGTNLLARLEAKWFDATTLRLCQSREMMCYVFDCCLWLGCCVLVRVVAKMTTIKVRRRNTLKVSE